MDHHTPAKGANRLINETSPYLLAHAHNPVDWYSWGAEALGRARDEDRPLLVSVGYSACHWCHVMERESFENPDIAQMMNDSFVCVKIDREERPDLDETFMRAVQMLTGSGGWPMTIFLTPDLKPFFGGTYFPPDDRMGVMGFPRLLRRVSEAWRNQRREIEEGAASLTQGAQNMDRPWGPVNAEVDTPGESVFDMMDQERVGLHGSLDPAYGGFGRAPKFPSPATLLFLLSEFRRVGDRASLTAVELTLTRMAEGGIQDHLAGGFHRYSVDQTWTIPHFEKMLYDNALLAITFMEAWLATDCVAYSDQARSILDFLLSDMREDSGGFFAAMDADSDGTEGAYYVWRKKEIESILTFDEAERFCQYYSVTEAGNFEDDASALRLEPSGGDALAPRSCPPELESSRRALLEARRKRNPPALDNKILTAWNGMTICALARFGALTGEERYIHEAIKTADYILSEWEKCGDLAHGSVSGVFSGRAFLDDYAWMAMATYDLYEATFDARWLLRSEQLTRAMVEQFSDSSEGMLYFAPPPEAYEADLHSRPRKIADEAVINPNALAWEILWRLHSLSGENLFAHELTRQQKAMTHLTARFPQANHYGLAVVSLALRPPLTVVIGGDKNNEGARRLTMAARRAMGPAGLLIRAEDEVGENKPMNSIRSLMEGKTPKDGRARAWVCKGAACMAPTSDEKELAELIKK